MIVRGSFNIGRLKKVTTLSTTSIQCHINCKTPHIYTVWITLTFALNYSQFECCAHLFQKKYFRNSVRLPVFLHTQIVNQTAYVLS